MLTLSLLGALFFTSPSPAAVPGQPAVGPTIHGPAVPGSRPQAETCYGGEGNYPYPCPQPAQPRICYGDEGNYPYPCPY